jgi:hypothetical protein
MEREAKIRAERQAKEEVARRKREEEARKAVSIRAHIAIHGKFSGDRQEERIPRNGTREELEKILSIRYEVSLQWVKCTNTGQQPYDTPSEGYLTHRCHSE